MQPEKMSAFHVTSSNHSKWNRSSFRDAPQLRSAKKRWNLDPFTPPLRMCDMMCTCASHSSYLILIHLFTDGKTISSVVLGCDKPRPHRHWENSGKYCTTLLREGPLGEIRTTSNAFASNNPTDSNTRALSWAGIMYEICVVNHPVLITYTLLAQEVLRR